MLFKDTSARKHSEDALEAAKQNSRKIEEQGESLQEIREEMKSISEKADSMAKSNAEVAEQAKHIISAVKQLKEDLEDEINSLKLSKNRMISSVVDKVQQEMEQLTSAVKQDYGSYLGVKKELSAVSSRLSLLAQEIDKFRAISSTIKAMDFEMKSYARALEERDSEKLRLIRRIEELQKIIARERRIRR